MKNSSPYDEFERALLEAGRAEQPSPDLRHRIITATNAAATTSGSFSLGLAGRSKLTASSLTKLGGLLMLSGICAGIIAHELAPHEGRFRPGIEVETSAHEAEALSRAPLVFATLSSRASSGQALSQLARARPRNEFHSKSRAASNPQTIPSVALASACADRAAEAGRERGATANEQAEHPQGLAAEASTLAAEQRLLEVVQEALRSQHGERAIALLELHARSYPKSSFLIERDVLWVDALVLLNRGDEAQRRAQQFLVKHAQSIQAERIRKILSRLSETQ